MNLKEERRKEAGARDKPLADPHLPGPDPLLSSAFSPLSSETGFLFSSDKTGLPTLTFLSSFSFFGGSGEAATREAER